MELGSRSAVPPEQPPNKQCAEAPAVLWGLKFILNVGVCEAHLFGDNAAALVQLLRCKASVGRVYQQPLLKCFTYLWASCPGFTVYIHRVRVAVNPADPISRLHGQFARDLGLAREAATRSRRSVGLSGPQDGFSVDPGRPHGAFCASAGMAIGDPVV